MKFGTFEIGICLKLGVTESRVSIERRAIEEGMPKAGTVYFGIIEGRKKNIEELFRKRDTARVYGITGTELTQGLTTLILAHMSQATPNAGNLQSPAVWVPPARLLVWFRRSGLTAWHALSLSRRPAFPKHAST